MAGQWYNPNKHKKVTVTKNKWVEKPWNKVNVPIGEKIPQSALTKSIKLPNPKMHKAANLLRTLKGIRKSI